MAAYDIVTLPYRTRVVLTAYKNSTAVPREADVQNAKIFVGQQKSFRINCIDVK